jgi:hypothetical protein
LITALVAPVAAHKAPFAKNAAAQSANAAHFYYFKAQTYPSAPLSPNFDSGSDGLA